MIEGFELIIKRAARGDSEAFAILLREKQSLVYNLAYRLSENREDASEKAFPLNRTRQTIMS